MSATIITMEDLQSFKSELIQEFKNIIGLKPKIEDKKWLKSKEVRDLLQISPGTLQTLRINGTLKYSKIGGTIFYDAEKIMSILDKNSD